MLLFHQLTTLFLLWLGLFLTGRDAAQQNPTLADVLKQEAVPLPPLNPKNELSFPLTLTHFDRRSGKWRHAELTDIRVKILEGTDHEIQDDCMGSVLGVSRHGNRYFLNLHFNPSAGCLLILNANLTVSRTLDGGSAGFFKSGLLIYSGDMVHFADVHPETLFLYDPVK